MALIVEGFTLLGTLKVPSVTGSASDVPVLVKSADYTAAMLASLKSDGGDLRFSSDETGLSQLPIEIVDGIDLAWTLIPTAATDQLIYVWGNKPAATQPAADAAFGSEAVWVDDVARLHLESGGASSTGSNDFSAGAGTVTYAAGKIGNAAVFNGLSTIRDSSFSGAAGDNVLVSAWVKPSNITTGRYIASGSEGLTNNFMTIIVGYQSGFFNIFDAASYPTGTASDTQIAATAGVWQKITYTSDGTTLKGFKNGVEVVSVLATLTNNVDKYTLGANGVDTPSTIYDGGIDEFVYANRYVDADREAIEYSNQSATDAWWIATDAGGEAEIPDTTTTTTSTADADTIALAAPFNIADSLSSSLSIANSDTIALSALVSISDAITNSSSATNADTISGGQFLIIDTINNTSSITNSDTITFSSVVSINDSVTNSNSSALNDSILTIGAFNVSDSASNTDSTSNNDTVTIINQLIIGDSVVTSVSAALNDGVQIGDLVFMVACGTNYTMPDLSTNGYAEC